MATKAIVKLLKAALKDTNKEEVINLIGISADEFGLLTDGTMEFSPIMAKKFGEALNIEPRTIMAAQADDQLNTLGAVAKPLEQVNVAAATKKGTGTDGRPSQSPMHRERSVLSISLPPGLSDKQANKAVRAVMDSFAD